MPLNKFPRFLKVLLKFIPYKVPIEYIVNTMLLRITKQVMPANLSFHVVIMEASVSGSFSRHGEHRLWSLMWTYLELSNKTK